MRVAADEVDAWIAEAKAIGIRSIVCLLDDDQLAYYPSLAGGLLDRYRRAGLQVGHVPVPDGQSPPIPPERLKDVGREFSSLPKPVLIHCSAGIDRTGAAVSYLQGLWSSGKLTTDD